MAFIPNSNSVVAFQGTVPWSVLGNNSVSGTVNVGNFPSSVISINQGSVATVIIGGSIAASFTPPANQSVSGTIDVRNIPSIVSYQAPGSVMAVSGSFAPAANQSVSGTVQTDVRSSVAVVIIGGSILTSSTANQSVSGTIGASIIGNVNTTITSLATVGGFLNVNLVGGSILTSSTPNQSVSGTVGASIIGAVPTTQSGTWISSVVNTIPSSMLVGASIIGLTPVNVSNFPTNQNISGSVVAFQGTNPWIITGSVQASLTPAANQSVSGTVQTDVRGSVAVVIIGGSILTSSTANQSVSGTLGASIIGTVPVTQGGTWIASVFGNMSVIGTVPVTQSGIWTQSTVGQGPAAALASGWPIVNGEAADATGTFTNATQTTSVTNNNLDGYGNSLISITGTYGTATAIFEGSDDGGTTWFTVAAARDDTNVIETGYTSLTNISRSWQVNNSGFDSIRVRSTAVASGTVNVRISSSAAPNSAGATVAIGAALPTGTNFLGTVSVVGNLGSSSVSGTVGASIVGQLPAGTAMLGSVVAYQGVTPWVVNFQNSSIIAVQAGSVVSLSVGSVITVLQAASIVGTYAEDAASASGDKGFLVMGARNDTLASVTSNDGDYSSHVVGPAGELIAANAPFTKWVQGNISVLATFGVSVAAIPAQGASIFTYITGVQVANMSASSVLVTLSGATSSIIGYTVAPAGGGSNMVFPNALKTSANGAFTASVSGVSSVYLSAQGFISKT